MAAILTQVNDIWVVRSEAPGMNTYHFRLIGRGRDRVSVEAEGLDEARNAAVRYLGQYLSSNPGFANDGHWQMNVENDVGQSLLHIIVATVVPRGAETEGE